MYEDVETNLCNEPDEGPSSTQMLMVPEMDLYPSPRIHRVALMLGKIELLKNRLGFRQCVCTNLLASPL